MDPPALLVLVYGVPGAGKSTLIREMCDVVAGWGGDEGPGVAPPAATVVVELDEVLAALAAGRADEWTADTRLLWKIARREMLVRAQRAVDDAVATRHRTVVFLGDNFQLRSMQKQVFRLAAAGQCAPVPPTLPRERVCAEVVVGGRGAGRGQP